ncbi:MAG TPA: helix-turn-helix domain-containing protein [Chitinophagaceae bacterium]|nr:helix-turn-helix domain-containing protein [Chitinophagaceae bacterium]
MENQNWNTKELFSELLCQQSHELHEGWVWGLKKNFFLFIRVISEIRGQIKTSVAAFTPDTSNEMFQLAVQLVNQSRRNIFLTGKAGTGKTTFLKYIRENCPKQMAVVAPTGVAAINAGGVTIHSFFQLPLSPFIPEAKGFSNGGEETLNRHSLLSRLRLSNEKRKILQELELLVIDEISMVRCDTLDAIDTVLRHIRLRHNEPFGGVQVLFIGDMYQLPPIIPDNERSLLSPFYSSPYFFDSRVLNVEQPVYIEFDKIYRQSEEQFINLLNQVRNNELNAEGITLLEKRFQPSFRNRLQDGYIILTTHNYKADAINLEELQKLPGKTFSYQAEIDGEFYEKSYPADELLQLKEGAQVMFLRNDMEKSKRYFNGKIGLVTKLEGEKIFVCCANEEQEIEVKKETWENIRYSWNKNTRMLDQEVLGSFKQYPLRLAWAITIHKSQGLTFDKAIIDAGEAFSAGQVYVALSRCTNLDGMILQSRILNSSLRCDERIVRFSQNKKSLDELREELNESGKSYQRDILSSLFDFKSIIGSAKELLEYLIEHRTSFNIETVTWLEKLLESLSAIQETAEKFHPQLLSLFEQALPLEKNLSLQERIKAAAAYFINQIGQLLLVIQKSPAITDSRQHAKEYNESTKELFSQLSAKKQLMAVCNGQFDTEAFHQVKRKIVVPPLSVNAYSGTTDQQPQAENPNPELYYELKKLRDSLCAKKDLPVYMVAGSKTLDEMARFLPQSLEELKQISGFGEARVKAYGQQFLDIILRYCDHRQLQSQMSEKAPKRRRKEKSNSSPSDTKAESFRLYKEGKSVLEISQERKLTVQTIEGHLAYYVRNGSIKIDELVSADKLALVVPAIKEINGSSLIPIKEKLGDTISFGEIRLTLAWLAFQKEQLSM